MIFKDKNLRYLATICFCERDSNLCIFQENLFFAVESVLMGLSSIHCKNSFSSI